MISSIRNKFEVEQVEIQWTLKKLNWNTFLSIFKTVPNDDWRTYFLLDIFELLKRNMKDMKCNYIHTTGLATTRGADTELRFLARSFWTEFSAASARSSASSNSAWTLRYLAKLIAATSSYNDIITLPGKFGHYTYLPLDIFAKLHILLLLGTFLLPYWSIMIKVSQTLYDTLPDTAGKTMV